MGRAVGESNSHLAKVMAPLPFKLIFQQGARYGKAFAKVAASSFKRHRRQTLMAGKNQHVVPHKNGWAVKGANNTKATSVHPTQAAAAAAAKQIAINQQSEVVIHRPNGQIRDKDSFGNDPNPPKDTKH